jgi:hypothetical protein
MVGTRWHPSHSLTIGGKDVSDYLITADVANAVTTKIPSCDLVIDNINSKWTYPSSSSIDWHDPITLTIDGVTVFGGMVDEFATTLDKKGKTGNQVEVTGRGYAALLQDEVDSLHRVNEDPHTIINEIIAEYNRRRLDSSADPQIDVAINGAPTDVYYTFLWKKKGFWDHINDVSLVLGSPDSYGAFFDFWVDESLGFSFLEIGAMDSGVTIDSVEERIKSTRHIDSLPIKNDIWVISGNVGTIPLQMQPNYNGYGLPVSDPWTEGTAADYITSNFDTCTDDAAIYKIGSKSIKGAINAGGGALDPNGIRDAILAYFEIYFPFPTVGAGDEALWPGNPPDDVLNAYNECQMRVPLSTPSTYTESMRETMGEIVGVNYWLRTLSRPITGHGTFDHWIRVRDINGYRADSSHVTVKDNGSGTWQPIALPFGPSANYTPLDSTLPFEWSHVQAIDFMCSFPGAYLPPGLAEGCDINFDGFCFVKPLIVHAIDSSAKSLRTDVVQRTAFTDYWTAKMLAQGMVLNTKSPYIYWELENIGREDLQIGRTFRYIDEHQSLNEFLLRELNHHYEKSQGWTITATAWEQAS